MRYDVNGQIKCCIKSDNFLEDINNQIEQNSLPDYTVHIAASSANVMKTKYILGTNYCYSTCE